jgi:hypothetical protein
MLGIQAGGAALEDSKLWRVEESARGADRGTGGFESLRRLVRGDRVVAGGVGVLGLVPSTA